MADRSTAAVDVAQQSGAAAATTDGVNDHSGTEAKPGADQSDQSDQEAVTNPVPPGSPQPPQDPQPPEKRQPPANPEPPELHSGHKLARRYRLEECVTRGDGFSSWRAVDEMLRRAVGIHVLPAAHSRARKVLAAARSAALLGDPRFVQVLDAVEEDDLVYVVHEWLPDATELTALLAAGPLQPFDAYQMVRQLSEAMAAAHREGQCHLRLTPESVLRTESGQYRVRGLAVAAALHGLDSDQPKREDTEAIGALLYASLTQRWPYPEDAHGLTGLPSGLGLVAPGQVRAGVHRGLSELAMRAMANDGATPSRQEPACATPEDLAKAVAAMPKVRPPEPELSPYQRTTYQQGSYRQPPARQSAAPVPAAPAPAVASAPPPALPGRTGRFLKWSVSALLLAALGLGSWQVAQTMMDRDHGAKGKGNTGNKTSPSQPGQKNAAPLDISGAAEFSPLSGPIAGAKAPLAVDGKPGTAWVTGHFLGYPNFGNLPGRSDGSGIVVDLGSVEKVTGVDIVMYRAGQTVQLLAAPPSASSPTQLADFPKRLTAPEKVGGTMSPTLDKPVKTRYLLIHVTELAAEGSANRFRGGISEIKVLGKKN